MKVTPQILLAELPPYQDVWVTINPNQTVRDIIVEVLDAHKEFAPYYDTIAPYFDAGTIDEICANLYNFCKANIRYQEESEEAQTSALPSGILTRGYGDCKHYSGFSGGILDALNRTGRKINWNYRFASYNVLNKTPHHVFIVVTIDDNEIWIDPTPGALGTVPTWQIDKKVKAQTMALHRNIAGFSDYEVLSLGNAVGITVAPVHPATPADNNLNFDGTNKYAGVFNPYLGLSMYRDFGGDRDIKQTEAANEINQAIAAGPHPGHTVTPDFVKWVYNANIRSWNFYYPGGVKPGFSAADILPPGVPRWIITEDGRLTFDRDIKVDDYRNAEIHLLTAWAQALINQYDPSPYPVKPQHIKEFSQLLYGNVDTRNLFTERRGASFLQEVGKALEDTVNFVKEKVLVVVGFVPRNAFLGLVGINAFNFAGNLWDNIQAGKWDNIANTWKNLGGKPDKLYNTIEDGKEKNPILGQIDEHGNIIGADPATDTAALLAAAAPIIAALMTFLDKEDAEKLRQVLQATKGYLQTKYPDVDLSMYGFLDQPGGTLLQWEGDPRYNENLPGVYNPGTMPTTNNGVLSWASNNKIPVAAGAALVTYLVTNKKGKKPNYIIPLAVGGGAFLLLTLMNNSGTTTTGTNAQRQYLNTWVDANAAATEAASVKQSLASMTDAEINTVYIFISQYLSKGVPVPAGSQLQYDLTLISSKYNIFT